ncbi:sulfatase-like hydrolase/transferase [Agromyces mediolanus]|uniref:sulfatase family protein n=1 Tax=Agromyces mediolanus TaxID=41986 RepID=UPI00203A4906|nr:sulfatase-like hydrolase/transferase [Agromyces mediolanus]MCM3658250.1 sulfatase-like hydrolase/transferase [Agromyces mediolanus]
MTTRKNIILFMTDEQRRDYVGYSGSGNVATPHIDRIAEGTAFSGCTSSNPICAPARASLLTGRYPHQIGMLAMYGDLDPTIPTYAQILQRNGYHTAAAGKLHVLATWAGDTPRGKILDLVALREQVRGFGFDELWETAGKQLMLRNYCDYGKHLEERGLRETYLDFVEASLESEDGIVHKAEAVQPTFLPEEDYIDVVTADRALGFLRDRPRDKPFFLFTSFCGPHMPFDPPQSWIDRVPYEEVDDFVEDEPLTSEQKEGLWQKRRNYKAMIQLIDAQIGRIIDYLEEHDLLDDTVLLFTSDHGEMLGDHGRMGKAVPWWQSASIPLAVRHPDHLDSARNSTPVSLVDVAATILDSAGIDPAQLRGDGLAFAGDIPARSLLPIVRGETGSVREYGFAESGTRWQLLETEEWKYVYWFGKSTPDRLVEELYHRRSDPDEQHNLALEPGHDEILEWFRARRAYELDQSPAVQTIWAPLNLGPTAARAVSASAEPVDAGAREPNKETTV